MLASVVMEILLDFKFVAWLTTGAKINLHKNYFTGNYTASRNRLSMNINTELRSTVFLGWSHESREHIKIEFFD